MEELQEKVKNLALGIQELFECPVCFGTMDSTLQQCINGHGVCKLCASKIEKCPTCQQELASVVRQNTLLGQVLELLPKPCPYTDEGCDAVVFGKDHQTYCEYRPTECKSYRCDWKGCVKDLLDHIRNCKKSESINVNVSLSLNKEQSRNYTFELNETTSIFTPIICQNQVFWKCFHRNCVTKCISHKLYYMPTSKQNCNYFLVISFKKGSIEFKHACKASTDIDNYDQDNLVWSGVTISDSELQYFQQPGSQNKYDYTVKIVMEDIP